MATKNPTILPFPAQPSVNEQQNLRPLAIEDISDAHFAEAAEMWLSTRRFHLAPRTYEDYGRYIQTLARHFGRSKLSEITGDQMRAYQRMRMAKAGPGIINKECGVVVQMRSRIGIPLPDYQRMPMPRDYESPGRALAG